MKFEWRARVKFQKRFSELALESETIFRPKENFRRSDWSNLRMVIDGNKTFPYRASFKRYSGSIDNDGDEGQANGKILFPFLLRRLKQTAASLRRPLTRVKTNSSGIFRFSHRTRASGK